LAAGPYDYYENKTEGFPPMRIYLRKTLMADFSPAEMFTVTRAGMTIYKDYFGKAYPFAKYD
jgi:aminopeptidase N